METPERAVELPIKVYSRLRALHYYLQFQTLNSLGRLLPFVKMVSKKNNPEMLKMLLAEVGKLFDQDAHNIAQGIYPISVLKPESLKAHARRVPRLMLDGLRLGLRRRLKRTKDLDDVSDETLSHLPEYFRRNFHFQTDGYLSERSADLYEHQVELLFSGTAAAMRRLLIAPLKVALKDSWGSSSDGSGLRFLEVGAGTGAATRFMNLAFPRADILAIDLSEPYLARARENLIGTGVKFDFGDGTNVVTQPDDSFDVIYSVFLMHEMPRKVRCAFIAEARRLLKPGGYFAYVDSLQLGTKPEFDGALEHFPRDFHEPFYAEYVKTPMASLLDGFDRVTEGSGFLSQYGIYRKPKLP